jgi:hypothetical protein
VARRGSRLQPQPRLGSGARPVSRRPSYLAQVAGIAVTVVTADGFHNGQLHDSTADYFAPEADGTVYSVDKRGDEFAHGKIVNHDGTWLSEVNGVQPWRD